MKRSLKVTFTLLLMLVFSAPAFSVEIAPRISDREIIESLSQLKEGQRSLEKRMDDMNARMEEGQRAIRTDMNARFNILTWMIGLFISIAIIMLGFLFQILRQMNQRQTQMERVLESHENALETQKDEINFLKGLIERLLPST